MKIRHKAHVKWIGLLLCILALSLFLVACGTGEGTTPVAPTPTPAATLYTGDGYTLSYPHDWAKGGQALSSVVFTSNNDPTTNFTVSVTPAISVPPGLPAITLDTQLDAALTLFKGQSQNYEPDTTVPSTVSVGGDSWKQQGGTIEQNGQKIKGVILADQHPANTGKIYVITLAAKADKYDQEYSSSFKPILDSFKFT
jgi:hypothetical protein